MPHNPLDYEFDEAFGYGGPSDQLTEEEIDALYVAEMERQNEPPVCFEPFDDNEAASPAA